MTRSVKKQRLNDGDIVSIGVHEVVYYDLRDAQKKMNKMRKKRQWSRLNKKKSLLALFFSCSATMIVLTKIPPFQK